MALNLLFMLKFLFFFPPVKTTDVPKNIYDFKVKSLDGNAIDFSKFKGKKILIVNTASQCGYTPQYKELEAVYEKHKDKLVIVGFPANEFGQQEPGTDKEISSFCQKNYGVTFPMASKIIVKGNGIAPIYQWLTQKRYNGFKDSEVKWNFQKYLINEQGQLVAVYESNVKPDGPEITEWLSK